MSVDSITIGALRGLVALGATAVLAAGCGALDEREAGGGREPAEGKADGVGGATKSVLPCGEWVEGRFGDGPAPHRYPLFGFAGERIRFSFAYYRRSEVGPLQVTEVDMALQDPAGAEVARQGLTFSEQAEIDHLLTRTGRYELQLSPKLGRGKAEYWVAAWCGGRAPVKVVSGGCAGRFGGTAPPGAPVCEALGKAACGGRPDCLWTQVPTFALGQTIETSVTVEAAETLQVAGCFFAWEKKDAAGAWQPYASDTCDAAALEMMSGAQQAVSWQPAQSGVYRARLDYGYGCDPGRALREYRHGCEGQRVALSAPLFVRPVRCEARACSCNGVGIERDGAPVREAAHACAGGGLWAGLCYSAEHLLCGRFAADGVSCGWTYAGATAPQQQENIAWHATCMTRHGQEAQSPPAPRVRTVSP